ncbi:acyl-CoA synthetase [Azospirillum cavernae]|uniref:Acyl-CoA synthetase n=1 Tax=Azospirillum cavernae TaxID=2320860 RepID=A0A418VQ98_9PROT|nr:AMP-binding protein [Azospirillum cavernae]RJF78435.1 acyl-CoA synthetase [Azospirillum cavernae]
MIRIDDRSYSRAEVEALIAAHAKQARLSDRPGARFAVCFANTIDWLALFFAIRAAGGSLLPLHPSTPLEAARRLARDSGCHALYHNSLTAEEIAPPPASPEPGQLLQMSSGTTGAPKRIARSWAEIDREIESYVGFFTDPVGMTPVIACPTTHSYGLICGLLVGLRRGAEPVILDTTNPKFLLTALRRIDKPLLYSSPVILHTLARLLPEGERIHAAMTSGTLLPEPWFERIRSRTVHMFQQYGCSEAGCIAINPDMVASAELGRVLPHHRLSAGTADAPAEIVLSASDGAIHTRDLGYVREDGMLMFLSRLDDTINVAGLNVYPQEVEDVAMALPGVTDAVAFRRTDRFAGERVALLFSAAAEVTDRALRDWCRDNLAAHQQPGELIRADALPRMANGKISRREVAARYAGSAS